MRTTSLVLALALSVPTATAKMYYRSNTPFSEFPTRLKNNIDDHPWQDGYLLPTKPPYNAAGDGVIDDTRAIRDAIEDAYAADLAVYFPAGTYLMSGDLRMIKRPVIEGGRMRMWAEEKKAYSLVGAPGAMLKLEDGSNVDTWLLWKYELEPGASSKPERLYSMVIRGLTLDAGNNPQVTVLKAASAQQSFIQDLTIKGDFGVGIDSLPGSGGMTNNLTIIGGRIGVKQNQFRPTPSIIGAVFKGQTESALRLENVRSSFLMAGFEIVAPDNPPSGWEAIQVGARRDKYIILIDGVIDTKGTEAVDTNDWGLYMENVWTDGSLVLGGNEEETGGWRLYERFAYTVSPSDMNGKDPGRGQILDKSKPSSPPDGATLWAKHSWTNWTDCTQDECAVSQATSGDSSDDDAQIINAELASGKPVFLPRGDYHIKSPIVISAGQELIGPMQTLPIIKADNSWKPSQRQMMLKMEGGKLSDVALLVGAGARVGNIEIDGNMSIRSLQLDCHSGTERQVPKIVFGPNAAGKIWSLTAHHCGTQKMAVFHGTQGPLDIYQMDSEHVNGAYQVEMTSTSNVRFLGFKYEPGNGILKAENIRNLAIYGGGGNYALCRGDGALLQFSGLEDAVMVSLSRRDKGCSTKPASSDGFVEFDGRWVGDRRAKHIGLFLEGNPMPIEVSDSGDADGGEQRPSF